MKEFFQKLNINYKTALVSSVVLCLLTLAILFMFFIGLREYPQGLLLGGLVGILPYLFFGLTEAKDKERGKFTWTIVINIVRFVFILGVMFLCGYLYYDRGYHIFNMFTLLGGYFIPLVTYTVLLMRSKQQ